MRIFEIEAERWPVESKSGYFYLLFAELTKDGHKQLATLREATPYSYIPKEDGRKALYKDVPITAGGKRIEKNNERNEIFCK